GDGPPARGRHSSPKPGRLCAAWRHSPRLMRRSAPSALHFGLRLDRALGLDLALPLGVTRSGSFAPPVSRFHSSKVWLEILPSTRSCANFRRWAWLLNGISRYPPLTCSVGTVRTAIGRTGHRPRTPNAGPRLPRA